MFKSRNFLLASCKLLTVIAAEPSEPFLVAVVLVVAVTFLFLFMCVSFLLISVSCCFDFGLFTLNVPLRTNLLKNKILFNQLF